MKRVVFGGLFIIALYLGLLSWHLASFNVQARTPSPTQSLRAYKTTPGLPDPNAVFAEVNEVRTSNGLQALVRNNKLAAVAQQRAQDMGSQDYYAHKSPTGIYFYDLFPKYDYRAGFSCENLDLEFSKTPSIYVNAWLGSKQGHRECLLDPRISEAGYAAAEVATSTDTNPNVASFVVVAIYAEASH